MRCAPSLPLIRKKKKILQKLSKRDGFCTFKFLKEWMDTSLSFIPMRGNGQIKELLQILAKQLVKSPITSDEVGVGKQQYDSKFQHQSQEFYKNETRGIILCYRSESTCLDTQMNLCILPLVPLHVLSFYQWLGRRQDTKAYEICRWHRAGRNH